MDVRPAIVSVALPAKSNAETPTKAASEGRSEAMRREISVPQLQPRQPLLPASPGLALLRVSTRNQRVGGVEVVRVALVALSEGGFSSVGHLDPLVRRGLGVVVVVPVPPLVQQGAGGNPLASPLPSLLTSRAA